MKKGEETKKERFDKVKGHHLTAISNKLGCDHSYVYMIVHGQRAAKSALAKKVIAAARILQSSLELAEKKTNKKLVELDQD
jgi:cyanate lyase